MTATAVNGRGQERDTACATLTATVDRGAVTYAPAGWEIALLPTVQGDASLLEQVFVNLLSNAVKFTRSRERARIEVGYRFDPQAGHTTSVRDNGVGFDPAHAGRLFSPFRRLHRADEFEGNGIGLANVKRIVERHGGTVQAAAELGRGATFSFVLPG